MHVNDYQWGAHGRILQISTSGMLEDGLVISIADEGELNKNWILNIRGQAGSNPEMTG
jgi:hypothetical protein